jgi:hypothetical protein
MLALIIGLLVLGYFVLYFTGRKYLETFQEGATNDRRKPDALLNQTVYPPEKPYTKRPIYDLDDYEYSMIFQNEGSKEISKRDINDAMSRYPLDWTVQPPDSQYFQENRAQFEKSQPVQQLPQSTFKEIDGSDMSPLDTAKLADEEKKILQTYKPESSKGLLTYSLDDVKHLVDKIYSKRGLVPTIVKSKQAEDAWEITEVQAKDPHIVWEDDLEKMTERDRMRVRGEEVIDVPYTVTDVAAGLDPFFEPRAPVRDGKHDYTRWTSGLERSFAPTYPEKYWY